MRPIESIITRSVLLFILCGFDFCFLLTSYGVLRVLRISVNWITWLAGGLIIVASVGSCLAIIWPHVLPHQFQEGGNFLALIALFVAVYAACQWITRQWFLLIKKSAGNWLKQASKNVLMFLREHHIFFGWVVAAGTIAHIAFFLPLLTRISLYEEVTGFIALGIFGLIVLLGAWLWIETSLRKQRMPKVVHTIHASLTIAFFVVLFLHV